MTVSRAKPGPSGVKNSLRRLVSARRAIRTADPHTDRPLAVEADRPRVAIAVTGAGLERDASADGMLRRGRADQHIAHIPGRDRVEQPTHHRSVERIEALAQRNRL